MYSGGYTMTQSHDHTKAFTIFCRAMAENMNAQSERLADGRMDYTANDIKVMPEAISAYMLTLEIAGKV
jgi:hypothetical protein